MQWKRGCHEKYTLEDHISAACEKEKDIALHLATNDDTGMALQTATATHLVHHFSSNLILRNNHELRRDDERVQAYMVAPATGAATSTGRTRSFRTWKWDVSGVDTPETFWNLVILRTIDVPVQV
jgi:hypothetical protein